MSYTLASVHGQLCVWSCLAHSHIAVCFLFQSYCKTKVAPHRVGRIIKVKKTAFWVVARVILWFWPIFKCYSNHITPVTAPSLRYLLRFTTLLHYNFSLPHFALFSLQWSLLIFLNSRLTHKLILSLSHSLISSTHLGFVLLSYNKFIFQLPIQCAVSERQIE